MFSKLKVVRLTQLRYWLLSHFSETAFCFLLFYFHLAHLYNFYLLLPLSKQHIFSAIFTYTCYSTRSRQVSHWRGKSEKLIDRGRPKLLPCLLQSSREQLAIAEYARSLLTIPKQLAVNAAQDSTDLVAKLRAYHNSSQAKPEHKDLKWWVASFPINSQYLYTRPWPVNFISRQVDFQFTCLNGQVIILKKTVVIKMNDWTHFVWVSLFSSRQVKYQFTHPDG